jgi:translation initiation factor 2B subunit (eIF-2B alpha/beta/delta family)
MKRIREFSVGWHGRGATSSTEKLLGYLSEAVDHSDARNTTDLVQQINQAKSEILHMDGPNGLLLNAIRIAVHDLPPDVHRAKELVQSRIKDFIAELEDAKKVVITNGSRIIRDDDVVLTHCHSFLVWNACLKAHADGKRFRVYVTETRPRFDGHSIVKGLTEAGITTSLVIDSAAGYYLQNKSISKVMLGLDCISSDGFIYNKVGTYPICVCAHENKVPVYFLTTKSKIVQEGRHEISKVFFGKEEIASARKFPKVIIESPVFDEVPAEYADYVLTEGNLAESRYLSSDKI